MNPVYCIDASSFIALWVENYPLDVFPQVWKKIEKLIEKDRLKTTRESWDEINQENFKKHLDSFKSQLILRESQDARDEVANLVNQYPGWQQGADAHIVAYSKINSMTVVAEELPEALLARSTLRTKQKKGEGQIPDVCKQLGIPCFSLMGMFRKEKWSF